MRITSETTLSCIGLPPRLVNTIEDGLGIVYVVDLCEFTAEDLLTLPSFGEKLLRCVRDRLAECGAHLASERPPPARASSRRKLPQYSRDIEAFG
jgi:DNA-directed RNA polymerase alpha subunit